MKQLAYLAGATALAASFAAPAFAQSEFATGANVIGATEVSEEMRTVEREVRDDFARSEDAYRFGPGTNNDGVFGSVALSYVGRDGNNSNQDFNLSGRLSHTQGQFTQSVGLLLEYGENNAGTKDTEKTSVIYDASYYFDDSLYGFIVGRAATDGLADDRRGIDEAAGDTLADLDGRLKRDAFIGAGPGYRIINNDTTAWRVQAGVGVRYTKTTRVSDADVISLESDTDVGYIASSRFYHRFNDMIFLTNDTDYLTSDANDIATNELGVNFQMTDSFATRVSYKTEYVSDRAIRTDNTLGVSLVYGF